MPQVVTIKYGDLHTTVSYDAEELSWVGGAVLPNGGAVTIDLTTEYPEPRQAQVDHVQKALVFLIDEGLEPHVSDIYQFFCEYKEKTLAWGNIWAEDFDQVKSSDDILKSFEEITVDSDDGIECGLSCRVLVLCNWIDFGGLQLTIDSAGKVSKIGLQE